jgi:exonuclease III
MNLLSFNIRGLGGRVKVKKLNALIRMEKVDLMVIQGTKMGGINYNLCDRVWGSTDYGFTSKDAIGNSGGLLCIWNS